MSKQVYITKFSKLNVAKRYGHKSPHKVCLLLSIISVFENAQNKGSVIENQFFLMQLHKAYIGYFELLGKQGDFANPYFPFFHLKSEGFWHLKAMPGQENKLEKAKKLTSFKQLNEIVYCGTLDNDLFNYLHDPLYRIELKKALIQNLDPDLQQGAASYMARYWSQEECYATVHAYFNMLHQHIKGEKVNKTEVYRQVAGRLVERTPKAVEFKFQNISAVLLDLEWRYIPGLKPAGNYQGLLYDVVCQFIEQQTSFIEQMDCQPENTIQTDQIDNILDALIEKPERRVLEKSASYQRVITPFKTNFSERESKNRLLGENGEKFVIEYEKARLIAAKREDLAKEIEWTSKDVGDGTGYDIRSFNLDTEQELFIEVKTTNSGIYQPFFISDNELQFSEHKAKQYSLYRVFEFNQMPNLFMIKGNLKEQLDLQATQFRASL